MALEGEETDALIGEAVFLNGNLVGSITSAAYGHTVGQSLAIGFLKEEARAPGTVLEVSLLGKMVTATVLADAPHDPLNLRLKV